MHDPVQRQGRSGCVIDDHGVVQRRGPSWKSSLGHVLEVACDYKHVGPFVTVTGGLMRSFCRRLVFFFFFKKKITLSQRVCDSRLLYGVESWPCCTSSAIQKLHVQRMKRLRGIDSSEVRSRVMMLSNPQGLPTAPAS